MTADIIGLIIAGLLYAGASAFIAGPLITERLIEKSNWHASCQRRIESDYLSQRSSAPIAPTAKCNRLLFWMGRDGQELCGIMGNPDLAPLFDSLREQKRRLNDAKNKRLERAASQSGSRCKCAVSTTIESKRFSFALYAGSARLVAPASVKNLTATLNSNLNAPVCAVLAQDGR